MTTPTRPPGLLPRGERALPPGGVLRAVWSGPARSPRAVVAGAGRRVRPALRRAGLRRPGFYRDVAALPSRFHLTLLWMPPEAIHGGVDRKHWTDADKQAVVLGGGWDWIRVQRPIITRTIAQLAAGAHYTETEQYAYMIDVLERGSGEYNYRCRSVADVHAYFQGLVAAWEEIRAGRYRTQKELGGSKRDEIAVFVDRHGQALVGHHGNHRLQMARQAGLSAIPVVVHTVHRRWAEWCYDRYGPRLDRALRRGLREVTAAGGLRRARLGGLVPPRRPRPTAASTTSSPG